MVLRFYPWYVIFRSCDFGNHHTIYIYIYFFNLYGRFCPYKTHHTSLGTAHSTLWPKMRVEITQKNSTYVDTKFSSSTMVLDLNFVVLEYILHDLQPGSIYCSPLSLYFYFKKKTLRPTYLIPLITFAIARYEKRAIWTFFLLYLTESPQNCWGAPIGPSTALGSLGMAHQIILHALLEL